MVNSIMNQKLSKLPGLVGLPSIDIDITMGARVSAYLEDNDILHMAISGEPGTPTADGSYTFSTSGYVTAAVGFGELITSLENNLTQIDAPNPSNPGGGDPDGILLGSAVFKDNNEYTDLTIKKTDDTYTTRSIPVYTII